MSEGLKTRVLKAWGYYCFYCGGELGNHHGYIGLDHIIPKSRGGRAVFDNLRPVCTSCNSYKYNYLPGEWHKKAKQKETYHRRQAQYWGKIMKALERL